MWIQDKINANLVGDGLWQLNEPISYSHKGIKYTVLDGFTTDFASIPQFYQWRFNPDDNEIAAAAVIHDALYASESIPRALADEIFLAAMNDLGAGWWKRKVMHRAVRLGGGFTYSAHTDESIADAKQYIIINPLNTIQ